MPINDNNISQIPPYSNDYPDAIANGYHAILFKPSYAVQARELTQLQYVMQSQVERITSTLYKNGSLVSGSSSYSLVDVLEVELGANTNNNINVFVQTDAQGNIIGGRKIVDTGSDTVIPGTPTWSSGLTYTVGQYVLHNNKYYKNIKDVTIPTVTPPPNDKSSWTVAIIPAEFVVKYVEVVNTKAVLYVTNTKAGLTVSGSKTRFSEVNASNSSGSTETFAINDPNLPAYSGTITSVNNIGTATNGQQALMVHVDESVFFYDGWLIRCAPSSIVLRTTNEDGSLNYAWNVQTCKVGVSVEKSVATINHDPALGDPARGSNNAGAPGADRLKIVCVLQQIAWDPTVADSPAGNFLELIRLEEGNVIGQKEASVNSQLLDQMAERMYDQSGSFTTVPFELHIESDIEDPSVFDAVIEPGEAYIKGYHVKTISAVRLKVPKARTTTTISNNDTNCVTGSYVIVDIASTSSATLSEGGLIYLATAGGSKIGSANYKDIIWFDGFYRVFMFNVLIDPGFSFGQVRQIRTVTYDVDNVANGSTLFATISLAGGGFDSGGTIAQQFNTDSNTLVFPISSHPMAQGSIRASEYQFNNEYDAVPTLSGTLQIVVPNTSTDKFYPYIGLPLTSSLEIQAHYLLIDKTTGANISATINTITPLVGNNWSSIELSSPSIILGNEYYVVSNIRREVPVGSDRKKVLRLNCLVGHVDPSTNVALGYYLPLVNNKVQLNLRDVFGLRRVTTRDNSNNIIDVTDLFNLSDGQTDNSYEYASLTLDQREFSNRFPGNVVSDIFHAEPGYAGVTGPAVMVYVDWFDWVGTDSDGEFTLDSYDYGVSTSAMTASNTNLDMYKIRGHNELPAVQTYEVGVRMTPLETSNWFFKYDVESIPTYTSTKQNATYALANAVDYRLGRIPQHTLQINDQFVWNGSPDTTNHVYAGATYSVTSPSNPGWLTITGMAGGTINMPNDAMWYLIPSLNGANTSGTPSDHYVAVDSYLGNRNPNAFDTFANWNSTYDVFLPRIDYITLNPDQTFKDVQGTPSFNPAFPAVPQDSMPLYALYISPYTYEPVGRSVNVNYVNNQRVTFADLRHYDTRLTRLEQLVSLTMLEKKISDIPMVDNLGNQLLKNGIFADNFSSFVFSDKLNPDFKASLDVDLQECRPSVRFDNLDLVIDSEHIALSPVSGKNYQAASSGTGNNGIAVFDNRVLTINPIGEEVFVDQTFASDVVNVNPFNVFVWLGNMTLTPAVDNWSDTESEIVVLNQQSIIELSKNFNTWSKNILGQNGTADTVSGYDPTTGITWNNVYSKSTSKTTSSFQQTGSATYDTAASQAGLLGGLFG